MNATTACPRCNGALAPGAQFCGACGSPVGAGAAAPQPPPYAPPPQMPQMPQMPAMANMARGFSGAGGGNSKQVNVAGAPMAAFDAAMRAIEGMGAEVHYRQPPQGAKFLLAYKSTWSTMGVSIKYDGDVQVAPTGADQSAVRLSLKVRWGSAMPLFLTQAALTFFGSMFNLYFAVYFFFILALFLGITAWTVSGSLPEKLLKEIGDKIGQGGGFAPAPQAQAYPVPQPQAYRPAPAYQPAPQAAPAPMPATPTPAAPAGLSGGDDTARIMEQIKQLGALRDAGILSPAEFEAKKAELLARI